MEFVKEVVTRLERLGVEYAITGSIASSYWGVPRLTHDVDLVVVLSEQRASDVVQAFADRYYVSEDAATQAARTASMFNVIDTSQGFKADLWVVKGDAFDVSFLHRRRRAEIFPGFEAFVGSPEDVLLHKLLWHKITPSERQLGDAAGIAAVQAGRLDLAYLRNWASQHSTVELLEDVLAGKGLKST